MWVCFSWFQIYIVNINYAYLPTFIIQINSKFLSGVIDNKDAFPLSAPSTFRDSRIGNPDLEGGMDLLCKILELVKLGSTGRH